MPIIKELINNVFKFQNDIMHKNPTIVAIINIIVNQILLIFLRAIVVRNLPTMLRYYKLHQQGKSDNIFI